MSIHQFIDNLPDDLIKEIYTYGVYRKTVHAMCGNIYLKKNIYLFNYKLNLNDEKYEHIKKFIKRYNNLYVNAESGTVTITKYFKPNKSALSPTSELSITYKNDFIYYVYKHNKDCPLIPHIVRVYNNGDIWFTYAPLVCKKQTIIRNKLYAASKFIIDT